MYGPVVAIFVGSEEVSPPLEAVLRQAGAVFSHRGGSQVAIHYGSAAGELAVCVRAVGLVDRSAATKLVVEAPPAQLGHLMARVIGATVCPGGALLDAGAWWCRAAPDRLVLLCEPEIGARLRTRLDTHAPHHVGASVCDRSGDLAAIGLLGPSTARVLRELGAFGPSGDPQSVSPFHRAMIGGIDVQWLLEADDRAVTLVPRLSAGVAWRAIQDAGRRFGISCVGQEAARRYALLGRGGQRVPINV